GVRGRAINGTSTFGGSFSGTGATTNNTGVQCWSNGGTSSIGVESHGNGGSAFNRGVVAIASGAGANNVGLLSQAFGGTANWAAMFLGNTWATGTYQGSDQALKDDVRPLNGAMSLISSIQPR